MEEHNKDRIDKYLLGKMDPEEKVSFENELKSDEMLAFEVEMARLELDGMELMIEEDLRADMESWKIEDKKEIQDLKDKDNKSRPGFLGIILSGIFILGLAIWFFNREETTETTGKQDEKFPQKEIKKVEPVDPVESYDPVEEEKKIQKEVPKTKNKQNIDIAQSEEDPQPNYIAMAESAYQMPDFGTRLKSDSGIDTSQIARATDAMQQNNFEEAIRILQNYSGKNKTDANDILGHAYFNKKEFNKAADAFRKNQTSFRKKYESEWFLFLSLLAEKGVEDEEVKVLTKKLSEEGHPFHNMYKKVTY